jgi:hypothetical protein
MGGGGEGKVGDGTVELKWESGNWKMKRGGRRGGRGLRNLEIPPQLGYELLDFVDRQMKIGEFEIEGRSIYFYLNLPVKFKIGPPWREVEFQLPNRQ